MAANCMDSWFSYVPHWSQYILPCKSTSFTIYHSSPHLLPLLDCEFSQLFGVETGDPQAGKQQMNLESREQEFILICSLS